MRVRKYFWMWKGQFVCYLVTYLIEWCPLKDLPFIFQLSPNTTYPLVKVCVIIISFQ